MVRRKQSKIFYTGPYRDHKIWRELPIHLSSWSHSRSLMSILWMKRLRRHTTSTMNSRLSLRQPIRMLLHLDLSQWVQLRLKRKSPSWSQRKSNWSLGSTCSRIRLMIRNSKTYLRPPLLLERNRRLRQSTLKNWENREINLISVNRIWSTPNRDSWKQEKHPQSRLVLSRCSPT